MTTVSPDLRARLNALAALKCRNCDAQGIMCPNCGGPLRQTIYILRSVPWFQISSSTGEKP